MEETYKLKVNNEFEYSLDNENIEGLDIEVVNTSSYHILKDNLPFHTEVLQADFLNKRYTIKVNSGIYNVSISDHLDLLIDKMGFALSSGPGMARNPQSSSRPHSICPKGCVMRQSPP